MKGVFALIRFVDTPSAQSRFYHLCQNSPFGCKLAATAASYGFHRPFARFWLDPSTAYCQLDSALTLSSIPQNPAEARAFLSMTGASEISGPTEALAAMGLPSEVGGPALEKSLPPAKAESMEPVNITDIHGLLAELRMAGEWESFYLDLSHRLRHGTALAVAEYADGRLAGCAVAALSQGQALLSALGVREDCRRQGLGTRLAERLEGLIPGRKLYALREAGKNQAFYARLGFTEAGSWAACSLPADRK